MEPPDTHINKNSSRKYTSPVCAVTVANSLNHSGSPENKEPQREKWREYPRARKYRIKSKSCLEARSTLSTRIICKLPDSHSPRINGIHNCRVHCSVGHRGNPGWRQWKSEERRVGGRLRRRCYLEGPVMELPGA